MLLQYLKYPILSNIVDNIKNQIKNIKRDYNSCEKNISGRSKHTTLPFSKDPAAIAIVIGSTAVKSSE